MIKIAKTRGFMRDKFCVKFGLRKKSAFIKFSKNSVNLADKKSANKRANLTKTSANLPFVSKR